MTGYTQKKNVTVDGTKYEYSKNYTKAVDEEMKYDLNEAYTVVLDANGYVISKSAILIMCALVSGVITIFMGLYANFSLRPFYGNGNELPVKALFCRTEAFSFGSIMSIILISGIIFLALTIFGIRDMIVKMIPKNIKVAISASIGFFVAYLGFKNTGIGTFTDGIAMGDFTDPKVLLAIAGLLLIPILTAYNVRGAILIGIIAITIAGIPFGVTKLPEHFFEIPDMANLGMCALIRF